MEPIRKNTQLNSANKSTEYVDIIVIGADTQNINLSNIPKKYEP